MAALTQKQEGFCLSYVETGNASEAYRRNYSTENMKPESVNRLAKALMDNIKIASRLSEIAAETFKRHAITVDDLIAELEEARQAALGAETPQASAAAGATMGKAKMLGFLIEKNEHFGANGGPIEIKKIERVIIKAK